MKSQTKKQSTKYFGGKSKQKITLLKTITTE